ncbi:AraC family transcriptional regulator [Chitinophaga sp. HK235]|uniref:helix-turn-helix domain-containing protein n=1 Tax=Chitinophaga sp. HK235 TaxID=2952571 RepID=UPI001BA7E282|nr:hypothetical protein [Chitinophaga sp. HK235]
MLHDAVVASIANHYMILAGVNSLLEEAGKPPVHMEAVKRKLETNTMNVNEVMSDSKAFGATFKKLTGMLPVDYRQKYNKEAGAR